VVNKLIVADEGWANSLPEWLLKQIEGERTVNGLIGAMGYDKKGSEQVGDAEALAYLMTASLRAPIGSDFTKIYAYLTGKVMQKGLNMDINDLPDFVQEAMKGLSEWEQTQLDKLKSDLFTARGGVKSPLFDIVKKLKGGKI